MSTDEETLYDAVYVFHDSENCYIPSQKEVRDADGQLVRRADNSVVFHEPMAVQGVMVVKEVLRNALACKIGKDAAHEVDVLTAFDKLKYYFVRNNTNGGPFAPNNSTVTDFSSVPGFMQVVLGGYKDGAVDHKIKELMAETIADLQDLPLAKKARILFVLVSGDRDFASNLMVARRQKIEVVLIHSADQPVRGSAKQVLKEGFAPMCWLDIVAAARNAADNPYYHPLAPNPSSPAGQAPVVGSALNIGPQTAGTVPAATSPAHGRPGGPGGRATRDPCEEDPKRSSGGRGPTPRSNGPGAPNTPGRSTASAAGAGPPLEAAQDLDKVLCQVVHVANQKATWFAKLFSFRQLKDIVRVIHPAFVIREPINANERSADGRYPCCELAYSMALCEPDAPTAVQITEATQALQREVDKIVVDDPLMLQGLTPLQVKDNDRLKSFAQRERVYFNLPDLKAAMKAASAAASAPVPVAAGKFETHCQPARR
jgi:hypothetical protein